MNNPNITFRIMLLALGSLALSSVAQAVSPPPVGGYPNGNTAEGQNALFSLTTGGYNTAVGFFSLRSNDTASFNTAVGAGALLANVGDPTSSGEGDQNTATGAGALLSNTGASNTANGAFALLYNTTGDNNTAVGSHALMNNSTGNQNVAVGAGALSNLTGNNNIAIGYLAGSIPSIGDNNIYIGNGGVSLMGFEGNTIRIGAGQQATYVAGISGTNVMGAPVVVAGDGRLGVTVSSKRFKDNIRPMDSASDAILKLKPVTFRYKGDAKETPQFGLIAEEVAKVNPALALIDKEGKPYTVRYDAVNAVLLNEFLKEHRKVQELENGMTVLIAQVKEQAAEIQKVRAQVEMTKPATKVVANER